jgi:hypothetical protein
MADDAKRADSRDGLSAALAEGGARELRAQLQEARRALEALQRKHAELGDELETATVRALHVEVDLAAARKNEAESARQWLTMSADLADARARTERAERLLTRIADKLVALRESARGTSVEVEADELLGIFELHAPPPPSSRG